MNRTQMELIGQINADLPACRQAYQCKSVLSVSSVFHQ